MIKIQNYKNHSTIYSINNRWQITYYIFGSILFVLAVVNAIRAFMLVSGRISAVLFLLTAICFVSGYLMFRGFSLKAQDRAIRAEENLRYFVLTGKLFDKSLIIQQIIALRFAPDEELLALTERALKENLSNKEIKMAIKNWKADYHRA